MSNLARSIRDANSTRSTGELYAAEIDGAAASVDDEINVCIEAFHGQRTWGPCRWMPRVDDAGATVLPNDGDRCVVAFAETGEPGMPEVWVIAWWPS